MKKSHFCSLKRFLFCLEHKGTLFKAYFEKKQTKIFWHFFYQNRGLTPFENYDFWPYEKFLFCSLKRFPLYLGHQETLF